jgi:predicted DCC family thiol-disulfide oxidoreductase YuxK
VSRSPPTEIGLPGPPILLFDGVCNLCNAGVQFILDHEDGPVLRFASMESEPGAAMLKALRLSSMPRSMVLLEDGKCFTSSAAVCRVTRYLRRPWRWLGLAILIPASVRDVAYQWIADHRYKWFGRLDHCRVATAELAGRFL